MPFGISHVFKRINPRPSCSLHYAIHKHISFGKHLYGYATTRPSDQLLQTSLEVEQEDDTSAYVHSLLACALHYRAAHVPPSTASQHAAIMIHCTASQHAETILLQLSPPRHVSL